jgi:hypothetical protein
MGMLLLHDWIGWGTNYKIVEGGIRGSRIHFFLLHENEDYAEVKTSDGEPFHNLDVPPGSVQHRNRI